MSSRNSAPPPSRQRLLDAGLALFHDLLLPELWAGLSVSEVSRRAGVTRATFYANWPTQEDFVADLVRYNEDPDRIALSPEMAQALGELATLNVDIIATIHRVLRSNFEWVAADRGFRFELSLLAKAHDPVIGGAIRRLYREHDAIVSEGLGLVFRRWQREPRPPLTMDDVTTILDAVLEGLVLRHWFDPERGRPDLYEEVVLALLPRMTRRVGDTETLADVHREIDRYIDVVPAVGEEVAGGDVDVVKVLQATRRLLAETSWAELGLADVAAASGTAEADLYDRFRSKAGLATILLGHLTTEALARADLPADPAERLDAMVGWLTGVIDAHPELCFGAVAVTAGMVPPPAVSLLPRPTMRSVVADTIREGQAAGSLRPEVDADAFTEVFVRTLLIERISPGTAGLPATELLLDGLRDRRPVASPGDADQP